MQPPRWHHTVCLRIGISDSDDGVGFKAQWQKQELKGPKWDEGIAALSPSNTPNVRL